MTYREIRKHTGETRKPDPKPFHVVMAHPDAGIDALRQAETMGRHFAAELNRLKGKGERVKPGAEGRRFPFEEKALTVKTKHPDWTTRRIETEIGCSPGYLYGKRHEVYRRLCEAYRADKERFRHP